LCLCLYDERHFFSEMCYYLQEQSVSGKNIISK